MQIRPQEGHGTQCLEGPMSTDIRDEADRKRCVPTPQWKKARLIAVGTWWADYPMAMGMQRTRISTQCSGDDLDTKATRLYHQKMTKRSEQGSDRWLQVLSERTSVRRLRPTII